MEQQLLLTLRGNRPRHTRAKARMAVSQCLSVFGLHSEVLLVWGLKGWLRSTHHTPFQVPSTALTQLPLHSLQDHKLFTNKASLFQEMRLLPPALNWLVLQGKSSLESGSYFLTLHYPGAQPTSQTALGSCPPLKAPDLRHSSFLR